MVKMDQDFWNTATWNVAGLARKEKKLTGEFERENLDLLGIA